MDVDAEGNNSSRKRRMNNEVARSQVPGTNSGVSKALATP